MGHLPGCGLVPQRQEIMMIEAIMIAIPIWLIMFELDDIVKALKELKK